ncbi:hypothetical protein Q428_01835 [Fervidicella metallireducens AeB]|uniref:Uncharacterized protein n=1 Tax=Fervidicella metallireducens AeB TaxID=1403537 RepID=A0A017RY70_9CLOT|nr:hypothetical protein [Fervidicella metallireducens]EYE89592.1 hypothetical protein Q428_01835 [Fervidicella metallireducens AeB]
MKLKQLIFAFKNSILLEKNFEIISKSNEINDGDIREIEERFKYINEEEKQGFIEKKQIANYSFFKLKSGNKCLVKITFSEDDLSEYSGYAIILEEGNFGCYPVELLDSKIFIENPEDKENQILPELTQIEIGNKINLQNVTEFIKQTNASGLQDMISAVLYFKKSNLPVTIIDDEDRIWKWIAAIQMAFTVELAHTIYFTTSMIFKENTGYTIYGANAEESFHLNSQLIFDYKRGYKSKIEGNLKFPRTVELGYLISPEVLNSFHRFLSAFTYKEADERVEECFNLVQIIKGEISGITIDEITNALNFVNEFAEDKLGLNIFQKIETLMDKMDFSKDLNNIKTASIFIFKALKNTSNVILINRGFYLFYNMIDSYILNNMEIDEESFFNFYEEIKNMSLERIKTLLKFSLDENRISYLISAIQEKDNIGFYKIYVKMFLNNVMELGYSWNQAILSENIEVLFDMSVNKLIEMEYGIDEILETARKNEEYFIRLVIIFYNRIKSQKMIEGMFQHFVSIMESLENEKALEIRKTISKLGCQEIIFEEYKVLLKQREDKVGFFKWYFENVFEKIQEYKSKYYSDAVKLYIFELPAEALNDECSDILKGMLKNEIKLDYDSIALLIKGFEYGLALTKPSDEMEAFILQLKNMKRTMGIKTSPDIINLIDLALWMEKNKDADYSIDEVLDEVELDNLGEKRFNEYMEWFMPLILTFCKTAEDHRRIIRTINVFNTNEELFQRYIYYLERLLLENEGIGYSVFLKFIVYFFFYLEPVYKLQGETETIEFIKKLLLNILEKKNKDFVVKLDSDVKDEFIRKNLSTPAQWSEMYLRLMGNKNEKNKGKSILNIIKDKFIRR